MRQGGGIGIDLVVAVQEQQDRKGSMDGLSGSLLNVGTRTEDERKVHVF